MIMYIVAIRSNPFSQRRRNMFPRGSIFHPTTSFRRPSHFFLSKVSQILMIRSSIASYLTFISSSSHSSSLF